MKVPIVTLRNYKLEGYDHHFMCEERLVLLHSVCLLLPLNHGQLLGPSVDFFHVLTNEPALFTSQTIREPKKQKRKKSKQASLIK